MEKYDIPKENSLDSMEGESVESNKKFGAEDIVLAYQKGVEKAESHFAHDISKELDSNEIALDRYEEYISRQKNMLDNKISSMKLILEEEMEGGVKEKLANLINELEIILKGYGLPAINIHARANYVNMFFIMGYNAGTLVEKPAYVSELIKKGTIESVRRSINILIWDFLNCGTLKKQVQEGLINMRIIMIKKQKIF